MKPIMKYEVLDSAEKVKSIYYLYLAGAFTFYITSLIGYMMAWRESKNKHNSVLLNTHYTYQFKIMNINGLLNILTFMGALCYVFYLFTTLDFMNLDIEKVMPEFLNIIYIWVVVSIFTTVLFYYQTVKGLGRINSNSYI